MSSSSRHHFLVTIFIHCIPPDLALVDMLCSCSSNLSCCESVRLCYFFLTLVRPHFAAVHFHGNYGKKLAPLICLNFKSVFLLSDSSYAHLCQIVSTYPFCLNSIFIHFRIWRYTFIFFGTWPHRRLSLLSDMFSPPTFPPHFIGFCFLPLSHLYHGPNPFY